MQKLNLLKDGLSKFFLFNTPLLKENIMGKLINWISFQWVKDIKTVYEKRRNKKRTIYRNKQWDRKLLNKKLKDIR